MAKNKKDTSHVGYRNGHLFCYNCGDSYVIKYPAPISTVVKTSEVFSETHADCPKTWEQPYPDMNLSTFERALFWIEKGEHGTSAKTMLKAVMPYVNVDINKERFGHPHDPSDLNRCYELLKFVPELRSGFDRLRAVSETWAKLVDNWDELIRLLEEQIETDKSNGLYELMQKLGC